MASGVDKIGRSDSIDRIKTSLITASGTETMIPVMGRRNYIKITNVGGAVVEVGGSALVSGTGFQIAASGGTWEDTTDAPIYIVSTGADSELRVYERATR